MKKNLDEIDIKFIAMLTENARRPLVSMAKELGLSRSATQERLDRLHTSGVIRGYTALIQWPDDTDLDTWLMLKLEDGVKCAYVVPQLLMLPKISLCHALAGNIDILLRVNAATAEAVSELRDTIAAIDGVVSVQTYVVLARHR
jgi:Lrp/AsnC family transcriptional regulator, leucine-responsive regulatory protein